MFTQTDHDHMQRALTLARNGLFTTTPNPRVGCVITREGQVVGEGWHHKAGEPHAELLALAQAGGSARGATLYVTLEPCSHFGRTPPCTNALIEAGIGRVIAAMEDPNPRVAGTGLQRLRDASVDVRCGLLEREARELNIGFVARMTRQVPWVRLKVALSLDGRSALADGQSQWITGEAARADAHRWRARACAVLTGIGTVKDDNPQLTVRAVETSRQPRRVLIDSRLEVDENARVLAGGALIYIARAPADKQDRLRGLGCEVVQMGNATGKVDLPAVMRDLARREFNEVHVEAGYKLNGSLIREQCVDELLLYIAPKLLGGGPGPAQLEAPARLADARDYELVELDRVGDDTRMLLRRKH